jgi:hypothetical protein
LSHHYPQVLARSCAICTPMFLQEHIAGLSTGFRWDVRPRERRGIGARESPRRARCSYRNISQDYWPGMSQTSPDGLEGSEFVPEEVSRSEECSWRNISSDFVSEIRHSSSSSLKKCSCRNIVENLQLAKSGLKAKQRSLAFFVCKAQVPTLWTVYLLHILLSWCKRLAKLGEYHTILLAWRRFCLPSDSDKVLVVVKLTLYSTLASVMAVIDELVTITAVILATPIPLVNFPNSIFPDSMRLTWADEPSVGFLSVSWGFRLKDPRRAGEARCRLSPTEPSR